MWAEVDHICPARLDIAAAVDYRASMALNLWGSVIAEHVQPVWGAVSREIAYIAPLALGFRGVRAPLSLRRFAGAHIALVLFITHGMLAFLAPPQMGRSAFQALRCHASVMGADATFLW